MNITTKVELQPFRTPNYVLTKISPKPREEGFKENPKYHLSELDEETLQELCAAFICEVYEKAGIQRTFMLPIEEAKMKELKDG